MIPLSVPNLKGNEKKYMDAAIDAEWVSTGGAYISDFEKEVQKYTGAPYAAACQSGTAALHLALAAKGIGGGQEVIVPTLTFIAAVNPVRYVGAQPVFMDCDDTLCMDMDKLEEFCGACCEMQGDRLVNKTTRAHVAAVIVVHVFGNMADMEKLMDIAHRFNLYVIEDATEALGSYYLEGEYTGCYAGTIGDIGAYSFNGNKIITTGGGGMIVSKNKTLLEHARYLSTQAKDDPLTFVHNEVGYNYRMTNVQAALGLAQMEQLESFIRAKADNYLEYNNHGIHLLPFSPKIRSNKWFYSYMSSHRDELIAYLTEHNIQSRPVWHLIHDLTPYQSAQAYRIEKAYQYQGGIVNLPCSTGLKKEEVSMVAGAVHEFEREGR